MQQSFKIKIKVQYIVKMYHPYIKTVMTCSQYVHIGKKNNNSILQILSHLKEDDLRMDCVRSFLNKAFTVTCNWTDNIMTLLPQKSTKKNRINDGDINNALRIDHEYKRMKLRLSYKKCNFDEWNANITNLYRVCCECIPNISANVLLTSRIYTECTGFANELYEKCTWNCGCIAYSVYLYCVRKTEIKTAALSRASKRSIKVLLHYGIRGFSDNSSDSIVCLPPGKPQVSVFSS